MKRLKHLKVSEVIDVHNEYTWLLQYREVTKAGAPKGKRWQFWTAVNADHKPTPPSKDRILARYVEEMLEDLAYRGRNIEYRVVLQRYRQTTENVGATDPRLSLARRAIEES